MTALAPNGVAVADYDPTGIGAVVFARISKPNANAQGYASVIRLGETVSGSVLEPISSNNNFSSSNVSDTFGDGIFVGAGVWKCLGSCQPLNDDAFTFFATLWMRVS